MEVIHEPHTQNKSPCWRTWILSIAVIYALMTQQRTCRHALHILQLFLNILPPVSNKVRPFQLQPAIRTSEIICPRLFAALIKCIWTHMFSSSTHLKYTHIHSLHMKASSNHMESKYSIRQRQRQKNTPPNKLVKFRDYIFVRQPSLCGAWKAAAVSSAPPLGFSINSSLSLKGDNLTGRYYGRRAISLLGCNFRKKTLKCHMWMSKTSK